MLNLKPLKFALMAESDTKFCCHTAIVNLHDVLSCCLGLGQLGRYVPAHVQSSKQFFCWCYLVHLWFLFVFLCSYMLI